ncbi:MAG: cyclic nucleotide-binding domain-containing protein [bacterium]|nr:cyclic nucleotide-binding domain-containing protein [bacterium]
MSNSFFSNLLKQVTSTRWSSTPPDLTPKSNANLHEAITAEFTSHELAEFYKLGTQMQFVQGQVIFHQNDFSDSFYIILDGEAEIYINIDNEINGLNTHVLATLKKDNVIGDMALVEDKPRSASVRAKSKLTVLSFNLDDLKKNNNIYFLLTRNMAKVLSERLRYTNLITVKKMEESLHQAQARNVLGVFMVAMFWLISLYTLSLTALISIEKHLANTTFLSVGIILCFTVGIIGAMKLTGLPLKHFGITLKNWPQQITQALVYSLPFMVFFLLLKVWLIYGRANPQHISLFSGFDEAMVGGEFSLKLYLVVVFLYAALSPLQELIARCALQTTFFSFLPGNITFRKWNAIILSNLIFSSVHSHLSFTFASLTFLPGLFWGWLFQKEHSFIGVSASHIVIGVWVIFIIGGKGLIY